jgi:hypothetical protein
MTTIYAKWGGPLFKGLLFKVGSWFIRKYLTRLKNDIN